MAKMKNRGLESRFAYDKRVIDALDQAYEREKPGEGVLHHSDRGSQYASKEYQKKLKQYKMIGSMSRKGCCYDSVY